MKRPRTDTLITIVVNRADTLLRASLRDLRYLGTDWRETYWSAVLSGAVACVDVFETPLQIGWCREHRDWCDIRVAGQEQRIRSWAPAQVMLPC